jgi:hypothetical protein
VLQNPRGRVMMSGLSRHEDGQQNAEQHSERLAGMGTRCHHIVMLSGSYYVRNTMIGPGCFIRIQSKRWRPIPKPDRPPLAQLRLCQARLLPQPMVSPDRCSRYLLQRSQ